MNGYGLRILTARLLIAVVAFWNLLAAFQFLTQPALYAPGFELSGEAGTAMLRGLGLLFVMWNVPYLFALVNPVRHRISLIESVIMQFIGAAGETVLLMTLDGNHPVLHQSVMRFITFDTTGVLLLVIALMLTVRLAKERPEV